MATTNIIAATNAAFGGTNSVESVSAALQPVDDLITTVLSMSPPMLLLVSLVLFGKVLKTLPINNKWIPAILFPLGAVGWCSLTSWSVVHFMQGHLFGGCAVGLHQFWTLSIGDTFAAVISKSAGWVGAMANLLRGKPEKPEPPADTKNHP